MAKIKANHREHHEKLRVTTKFNFLSDPLTALLVAPNQIFTRPHEIRMRRSMKLIFRLTLMRADWEHAVCRLSLSDGEHETKSRVMDKRQSVSRYTMAIKWMSRCFIFYGIKSSIKSIKKLATEPKNSARWVLAHLFHGFFSESRKVVCCWAHNELNTHLNIQFQFEFADFNCCITYVESTKKCPKYEDQLFIHHEFVDHCLLVKSLLHAFKEIKFLISLTKLSSWNKSFIHSIAQSILRLFPSILWNHSW